MANENYTVLDILGKGYKFEQRVETETLISKTFGTVYTSVGGAHWGKVNTPSRFNNGEKDYYRKFGMPPDGTTLSDSCGLSMAYHLTKSAYGWYTRITDGTDIKASKSLIIDAQVAKCEGLDKINDQSWTIYDTGAGQNDQLDILINGLGNATITLTPSPKAADIETDVSALNLGSSGAGNYSVNQVIQFEIDGDSYSYVVQASDSFNTLEDDMNAGTTPVTNEVVETGDGSTKAWTNISLANDFVKAGQSFTFDYTVNSNVYSEAVSSAAATGIFGDTASSTITDEVLVAGGSIVGAGTETGTSVKYIKPGTITVKWYDASSPYTQDITLADDGTITPGGKISSATYDVSNKQLQIVFDGSNDPDSTGDLTIDYTGATNAISGVVDFNLGKITSLATIYAPDNTTNIEMDYVYLTKTYAQLWTEAATAEFTTDPVAAGHLSYDATAGVSKIQFTSADRGSGSQVKIIAAPIIFSTLPTTTQGTDSDAYAVVEEINDELEALSSPNDGVAYFNEAGNLVIASASTGSSASVKVQTVANDAYAELGLDDASIIDQTFNGTDAVINGSLEAVYTGEEGNTIKLEMLDTEDGQEARIYFRDEIKDTFVGFDYDKDSASYLGTLINSSDALQEIVTFTEPTTQLEIPAGTYTLSGGTSGLDNIAESSYIVQWEEYKNIDLYDIDIICTSGMTSKTVVDKMIEVADDRKDCWVTIDVPQGLSPNNAIKWHNGLDTLNPIDTDHFRLSMYYPWIYIPIKDNADLPLQWHAPTTRVIGAISQVDVAQGNTLGVTAGKRTLMSDIQDVERTLTRPEVQRLHADSLGNNINSIVYKSNIGFIIDSQRTGQKESNSLNRINPMRTSLFIKKSIETDIENYFWQPDDEESWKEYAEYLNNIMIGLVNLRKVQPNYVVKCDTDTNTAEVIAANGMIGLIEWTPVKLIERIKVISVIKDQRVSSFEVSVVS